MPTEQDTIFGGIEEPVWVPEPIKIYTITLSDGSTIPNLTLNGNNFVSKTEITKDMFADKLSDVTIADDTGYVEHHTNMELLQIMVYDGDYYFIIRDIPAEDLYKMKVQGDLEYLAMMSDIDLN